MCTWELHELWTYYCLRHTPAAGKQQLLELTTKHTMATFLLCLNIDSTTRLLTGMTKNRTRLSFHSRLSGLLSTPLETHSASRRSFKIENAFLWSPLFMHTALYFWPVVSIRAFRTCSKAHLLCPQGWHGLHVYMKTVTLKNIFCGIYRIYSNRSRTPISSRPRIVAAHGVLRKK